MKNLYENAKNLINKLEEGVGEVPPQVPSPGNVSYYQTVDEDQGEWGPWNYSDGSWSIEASELDHYKKDPWGRPFTLAGKVYPNAPDAIKDSEGDITHWIAVVKSPDGEPHEITVWND